MNSRDTGIEISNTYGILSKIVKFIKNLFKKDNIKYITAGSSEDNNNRNDNSFFKSIKFEEEPEKKMLLKIQDDLEKNSLLNLLINYYAVFSKKLKLKKMQIV